MGTMVVEAAPRSASRVAVVVPAQPADAVKAWRRLVTAVDPAGKGTRALVGAFVESGVAYEMPEGAVVIACDVYPEHREVAMLTATDEGLTPVKTWSQKSPLGARVTRYVARRLPATAQAHRAVALEDPPNRWPGRCASCYQQVPAGQGRLCRDGDRTRVLHRPGQCPPPPPPPDVVEPNFYGGLCVACGRWVEPRAGVAVRVDTPLVSGRARYQAMHRSPCPADALPGPPNTVPGWCVECGELVTAARGYWADGLHHAEACPDPSPTPTWITRRHRGEERLVPGVAARIRIDLRRGGAPVPEDAPGYRVLTPEYVEMVGVPVEVLSGARGQRARVRAATWEEATDVLAVEVARVAELRVVEPAGYDAGYKARWVAERLLPPQHPMERSRIAFPVARAAHNGTPWLAEICGRDPTYRYQRRFLPPDKDYTRANRTLTRGVFYAWTLAPNRIYEAFYPISRMRSRQVFLRVTEAGDIVEIDREEVETWLDNAAAWIAT